MKINPEGVRRRKAGCCVREHDHLAWDALPKKRADSIVSRKDHSR